MDQKKVVTEIVKWILACQMAVMTKQRFAIYVPNVFSKPTEKISSVNKTYQA